MKVAVHSTPDVLLVDDETGILEEMQQSLAVAGVNSVSATSGREALRCIRSMPSILVIVTDLRMPGMDGFALIQAITDLLPEERRPQIVFISAHMDTDATLKAMRSDAVDFLSKPFKRQELVSAVNRALAAAHVMRDRAGAIDSAEAVIGSLKAQIQEVEQHLQSFRPDTLLRLEDEQQLDDKEGAAAISDREMRERLETLIHAREERVRYFPKELFSDPAWDMIIDLTQNRLLGHSTYVSSLAVGAQVPLTTTLRHLESLSKHELVRRFQDPSDKRRMLVELTPKGLRLMRQFLSDAIPSRPGG